MSAKRVPQPDSSPDVAVPLPVNGILPFEESPSASITNTAANPALSDTSATTKPAGDKPESAPKSTLTSVTKDFDLDRLLERAKERSVVPVDLGIEIVQVGSPKHFVAVHPHVKEGWAIPGDFQRKTDTWLVDPPIATLPHNLPICCPVALVACVEPLPSDSIWPIYTIWVIKLGGRHGASISRGAITSMERVKEAIKEGGWWSFYWVSSGMIWSSGRPEIPITEVAKWPSPTSIDPIIHKGFEETGHIIRDDNHIELAKRRLRR